MRANFRNSRASTGSAQGRGWESFDADTGKDLAREIREYFIPDFSNWTDQESYRKAFDQLLRDLRAEKRHGEAP